MNEPQPPPSQALFFAYFSHRATPLERQWVEQWLHSPEGAELYFRYLDEWERQHPQFQPDLETARLRFAQFSDPSPQSTGAQPPAGPTRAPQPVVQSARWLYARWLMGLAASVLLVAGLWLTTDHWYYTTQRSGFGQLRSLQLPDGSVVLLGANSSLRYARAAFGRATLGRFGFGRGERVVWLTGEAQFRVTHQPDARRFRVKTPDQTEVEVLGTVFSVNSRRQATRVVLETGRIRLTTARHRRPLLLTPGDVVTVSTGGQLRQHHQPKAAARVTWHDHRFVFADTPLPEAVRQLHDTFGVRVHLSGPGLTDRTLSGTFEAETADDLLQALTLMMHLQLRRQPNGYVLIAPTAE